LLQRMLESILGEVTALCGNSERFYFE